MIIYVYNKCSTCRDALRFLEKIKGKKSLTIKEITQEPPSLEELKKMLDFQGGNLMRLFNTSGQLYREMHLKEKLNDMTQNEALKLLTKHGMLIKRPFLIGKDFGLTGFKEAEYSEFFE